MDFIKTLIKILTRILKPSQQLSLDSESVSFSKPEPKKFSIPEKYANFPKYNGTLAFKPIETETEKYYRVRLNYTDSLDPNFTSTLLQAGFIQGSNVRYDRGNTYVIVEKNNFGTSIVYHVKK